MQAAPGRVLRADAFEACCQCESAEVRTNLLLGGGWMSAEFESEAFLRSALIRPVLTPLPVLLGCREEDEYVSAGWNRGLDVGAHVVHSRRQPRPGCSELGERTVAARVRLRMFGSRSRALTRGMLGSSGPRRRQRPCTAAGAAFIRTRWSMETGRTFLDVHQSVFPTRRGNQAKRLRVRLLKL